jgi:hypothetical protein
MNRKKGRNEVVVDGSKTREEGEDLNNLFIAPLLHFARFSFRSSYSFYELYSLYYAGALKKWRLERGWDPNNPGRRFVAVEACEHIVVLNKRDLVPEWGLEVRIVFVFELELEPKG